MKPSPSDADIPAGPIAYLTGEYPKVSHTFIFREVQALRRQGLDVLACTVRRPPSKDVVGADQESEALGTFCIIEEARRNPLKAVGAHVSLLRRAPKRWFSTLMLAWRTSPPGAKALLWQFFYFVEAGILADFLQRKNVHHLHNHFANSSCTVSMLTSGLTGIPFSFTLHGPAIFFEPKWWRLDEKIARARFVVCISHFSRSQAMLFSDESCWDKLHIVHCGVPLEAYGGVTRKTFGKNVMFVGRLDAVKGVSLLLDAFAAVRSNHSDAKLTIIGDGPSRAALEAKAAGLGIADATSFLGYRSQGDVAMLLQEADILTLPSFAEGVPVVLMEAMASRIPVIASRVAGVPELVEDGVSGFVVSPGDTEALTARLDALLSDAALCARMGEAGRTKVEEEFDIKREADRIAKIISAPEPVVAKAANMESG